jgi:hypothetical protein
LIKPRQIICSSRIPGVGNSMLNKTDRIRTAWAANDRIGALRIAAQFFDRSDATKTFQRGTDAYNHPHFYRQIGKEPEQIVATALDVLARSFGLI